MRNEGSALSNFFHNKWVRIILIANVVIIVVIISLVIVNATKTATIVLNITPLDSKITLNGRGEYSTTGTYQLAPGNYKVEISHEGLDSKTFDVNLEKGHITKITTYLTNGGDISFYKGKNQRTSFDKMMAMLPADINHTTDQDNSAKEQIETFNNDYKYMNNLPINDTRYEDTDTGRNMLWDITIRSSNSDECQTWLCIEALMLKTDDHSLIESRLKNSGFKLEDYEIIYKTY